MYNLDKQEKNYLATKTYDFAHWTLNIDHNFHHLKLKFTDLELRFEGYDLWVYGAEKFLNINSE